MSAAQEGWRAGRWSAPSQQSGWVRLAEVYTVRWKWYENTIFEQDAFVVNTLIEEYQKAGLYRNLRPIVNPTMALVERYVNGVYPGIVAASGEDLPDGIPQALPFKADTDPALLKAIQQVIEWTNFGPQLELIVRWGASLGDCFVEVVDDVAAGKVYFDVIWPGHVRDLTLDRRGNVKAYTLQYQIRDEADGRYYTYRREVTQETIKTFKNGEPYSYDGIPASIKNPYGFAPGRWFMHRNIGAENGAPAMFGLYNKAATIMSLTTRVADQVMKIVGAPVIIGSSGKWKDGAFKVLANEANVVSGQAAPRKRDDDTAGRLDREGALIIQAPPDVTVQSLLASLDFAGAIAFINLLQAEFTQDQPPLKVWEELRAMSQATGPAANRLVGDGAGAILKSEASYDIGVVSLLQMAVAIGGQRLGDGDWNGEHNEPPTEQQETFRPFNLESYSKGKLRIVILPRPLLQQTAAEEATAKTLKYAAIKAGTDAGLPLEMVLREEGWSDDKIAELTKIQAQKAQEAKALFQEMQPPPQQDPTGQTGAFTKSGPGLNDPVSANA